MRWHLEVSPIEGGGYAVSWIKRVNGTMEVIEVHTITVDTTPELIGHLRNGIGTQWGGLDRV